MGWWIASSLVVFACTAFLLWRWSGVPRRQAQLHGVLAAHGPARCLAAITLLRRLAAGGDPQAIAVAIDAIELPLVEAIPDCPPPAKPELTDALDACAAAVSNRALAKRITTLRNAVLAGG